MRGLGAARQVGADPGEERRYARIRHLVGDPTVNAVCRILAGDALARPITA